EVEQPLPPPRQRGRYPHVRAAAGLDAAVACFQMLAQHFQMPFRREAVRRVLADRYQRQGSLTLYSCGAIAELMSLNAQLVTVPAKTIVRLRAPALVRWQDSLAILYEISDRQLVIGVPEIGILRRKPADFIDSWEPVGQVLLLQPTKETPQERFGLSWFWPSLWRYRSVLIEVLVASFFVQLFGLANPLIIQLIIDQVIVKQSVDTLQVLGIFLLGVAVLEAILSTVRTYLFVDTTNRIDLQLGSEIIDHLLRLPLRYFDRRPVGELSSRVNELENIRQFLTGTALTVVLDAIFSVVYIAVMAIYSWRLTIVALFTVPLFMLLAFFISPIVRRQLRTKAERNAQTQSHLVEVMSGIQTVKAQNIELRSRWQWQEYYARYVSAGFRTVTTSTLANSSSNFLNKISGLLVLWVGAYFVLEGDLTLGQLIAFRIIASYVTTPLLRLGQLWQNFQETALSLERLADIVDTPQEAEADRDNIPMPPVIGAVRYENVTFRFSNSGAPQLLNVNLDIPAGQFVGVVGKSGAGKSTLTKLLVRLYNVESGRILVDGYDVAKVELYSLRRQIGVVPQEPLLFDGTVQENIAMNNPDASSEEVIEAAQVAAAHDFIMELPSGYNTRVGERGSSLSGGQRQRLAIARTVLQRPQMLILDEATSALDYPTEQQVCANLARLFGDRTVFFITHRLGTVQRADTIVMMDAGAVVEQGKHEELMNLRGRYWALYQQQTAGAPS
ncbi:MAG: peptidase domain-containing ABC transporter, partial [Spirulinaceae cyanobacterium SM2_1_0]|nr:peptidase domain-containing ABC transporter [Spirulinaceae cyanobacterium SM2_1_0]